jgi:hypothetical protein
MDQGIPSFNLRRHVDHMRKYLWILIGMLSLSAAPIAQAQLPDLSKLTKDQVDALPPDVLNRLPLREVFKKSSDNKISDRAINLIVAGALNRLFYLERLPASATMAEIAAATAKFQRDINTPQTGQLLVGESTELFRRVEAQNIMPVYLPGSGETKIYGSETYVSVDGTWKIEGENIAWPINTSKIRCWKGDQVCFVIDLQLATPLKDSSITTTSLNSNLETYKITKWDAREVVAEQSGDCRATTMTLNRVNNEVFQITRNIAQGCAVLGQLSSPRITRLVSGWQISWDYWKARRDEANSFLSREHQLAIKELEQAFK